MDFKYIAFKIFKKNFRKYILLLLSCSYSVMVFFIFSTVYTNKSFMSNFQAGTISSNIIAPSICVAIFSVFLISYSYNFFFKFRKRELGLFMILGMTDSYIIKMLAYETIIVATLSIVLGVVLGTLISPAFYYILTRVIRINSISLQLSLKSYIYSITFFSAIFVFMFVSSGIDILRCQLINLLKQSRIKDNNFLCHPIIGLTGLFMIVFSFLNIYYNITKNNSTMLLIVFSVAFLGLYFCMANIIFFSIPLRISKKIEYNYMLFLSNIKYKLGQTKKVLFITCMLASVTIFFITISIVIITQSKRITMAYNPFDIAYAQLNRTNTIADRTMNKIIIKDKNKLVQKKKVEFMQINNNVYLMDKELNENLNCRYHVKKGDFISLFQVVKDDGYEHNTQGVKSLYITIGKKQHNIIYKHRKDRFYSFYVLL